MAESEVFYTTVSGKRVGPISREMSGWYCVPGEKDMRWDAAGKHISILKTYAATSTPLDLVLPNG